MQFITSIALLAGLAAALPAPVPSNADNGNRKFGLIAIRSGSPIQNTAVTASKGHLLIGGNNTDAACECDKTQTAATFEIYGNSLFLYNATSEQQQVWVDETGMGEGITGYTTGPQDPNEKVSRGPFTIDSTDHLNFDNKPIVACPADGGYSIWFTGLENPGNNKDCLSIFLRVVTQDDPVSCTYSEYSS